MLCYFKKEGCDVFPKHRCINIINKLIRDFQNRFKDIGAHEILGNLFENSFNIDPINIESSLQLEIIEHQSKNYIMPFFI